MSATGPSLGKAFLSAAFVAGALAGAAATHLIGGGTGLLLAVNGVAAAAASGLGVAILVARRREARSAHAALARRALVLEAMDDGVVVVDRGDRIVEWTPSAERMYGYSAAEAMGQGAADLLHARVSDGSVPEILAAMEAGLDRATHEAVHRRKDGTDFQAEVAASALREDGQVAAVVLVVRDVTAQRRTERALRESEQRLALALAGSDSDVWDWDRPSGRFFLGEEWSRRLGITGALFGRLEDLAVLVHPDDRARVAEALRHHVGSGEGTLESVHRVRLADGSVRWAQMRGRVTERAPDGTPSRYTGTLRDVTEAKELQARLERSDRLASLGTLAAGVAHEVNNPVAYVAANLGFVRDELARAEVEGLSPERLAELQQAVQEALSGATRVRKIVAGLKQFAAPADRTPTAVDVRAELEAALGMTRHELAQRARLTVQLPEALPPVVAGPTELGQVFVNLLVNAARSLPEGNAEGNEVRVVARAEAGRVMVEISDTGVGIPADVLPRIFDPFFTTRPVGGGTGLGLSICHGIVNGVGGAIEVESTPGQGSTFRVVLPAGGPAPAPAIAGGEAAPWRGRVLVVDDEPLVGRALARILADRYDVTVSTAPAEALALVAGGARFDLVLCDLMMPDVSGMELEARLAEAAPELVGRMVFMTGGTFTPAARAFLDAGRPHLEKPIEAAALRELVARRLGR